MPVRRVRGRVVLPVALLLAVAAPLAAQAPAKDSAGAPAAGTWGAEAAVSSGFGSLVRFQSPQWALLAGANVLSNSIDTGNGSTRFTTTSLRVGARRYARSGLGVRPVVGAGLTVFDLAGSSAEVGAYGELGAVYFFSRHLSLGVVGDASLSGRNGQSRFSANLARVVAGVFF